MWTAARFKNTGYGAFGLHGKLRSAHRVSFELANGPIPEGQCVLHRCDVRACVNPDHLFLGTKGDNNRDAFAKGRAKPPTPFRGGTPPVCRGTKNGNAKLTPELVLEIRASEGTTRALGRRFGVDKKTISDIRANRTWEDA